MFLEIGVEGLPIGVGHMQETVADLHVPRGADGGHLVQGDDAKKFLGAQQTANLVKEKRLLDIQA